MTLSDRQPLRPTDPQQLGEYTLLGRLGEGGMGTVFLARSAAGRVVAVKSIRHDLSGDPDFRRRFRAEVARAQQVPAYCTAEVLDADPDNEPPYLVVEHVEGPSLSQVVESRGPLSESNLHGLAIAVATALTGIHGAGVIHRDLKPSNVLLSLGSAKVIDFGIARTTDLIDTTATDPHQLIGSVHYMAPERLSPGAAQSLTAAADIFAWGAVVTFAGTGRTPFGGSTVEAAARILLRSPDLTGLHGPLRDLVEQALSKDPNDRPTARELLDRLLSREPKQPGRLIEAGSRQAVVAVATGADTTRLAPAMLTPPASAPPRRTRRRTLAVVAGIVVLAAVAAATLLTNGFGLLGGAATHHRRTDVTGLGAIAVAVHAGARAGPGRARPTGRLLAEPRRSRREGDLLPDRRAGRHPDPEGHLPLPGLRRSADRLHRLRRRPADDHRHLCGDVAAVRRSRRRPPARDLWRPVRTVAARQDAGHRTHLRPAGAGERDGPTGDGDGAR